MPLARLSSLSALKLGHCLLDASCALTAVQMPMLQQLHIGKGTKWTLALLTMLIQPTHSCLRDIALHLCLLTADHMRVLAQLPALDTLC